MSWSLCDACYRAPTPAKDCPDCEAQAAHLAAAQRPPFGHSKGLLLKDYDGQGVYVRVVSHVTLTNEPPPAEEDAADWRLP
jgi:hypothetical protein